MPISKPSTEQKATWHFEAQNLTRFHSFCTPPFVANTNFEQIQGTGSGLDTYDNVDVLFNIGLTNGRNIIPFSIPSCFPFIDVYLAVYQPSGDEDITTSPTIAVWGRTPDAPAKNTMRMPNDFNSSIPKTSANTRNTWVPLRSTLSPPGTCLITPDKTLQGVIAEGNANKRLRITDCVSFATRGCKEGIVVVQSAGVLTTSSGALESPIGMILAALSGP